MNTGKGISSFGFGQQINGQQLSFTFRGIPCFWACFAVVEHRVLEGEDGLWAGYCWPWKACIESMYLVWIYVSSIYVDLVCVTCVSREREYEDGELEDRGGAGGVCVVRALPCNGTAGGSLKSEANYEGKPCGEGGKEKTPPPRRTWNENRKGLPRERESYTPDLNGRSWCLQKANGCG